MDIARLLSPMPSDADAHAVVLRSRTPVPTATSVLKRKPASGQLVPTAPPAPKRKRKSRLSAKQIQVSRENQQDQSLLLNLTLDVNDLKQQVHDCLARKSMHETRSLLRRERLCGAVLRATERFFRLFRTGHRAWEPHEAAFFAATLDDQLVINSVVSGVDVFFEQWRRYKKLLRQRYFRIDTTRVLVSESDSCVVECKGEFEGRLTHEAVQTLFPHILADRDLLARVVDCRLVCPTRTLIYFDASGRIVQYDAHADIFEGLNRILVSNPVDVITLMARARISAEGSMIPDGEGDSGSNGGGDFRIDSTTDVVCTNRFAGEADQAAREFD
ncbi:hypothetical protein PybrP1_003841, partial [[Pythium] brassicae (nom. inval.)]